MARQYGIKHLAVATVIVFALVLAVVLFRGAQQTGPFRPHADCLRAMDSLGVSARSAGSKPVQDSLVYAAVDAARKNGLTGEQPAAVAMYMNFAAHSAAFDTSQIGVQLVKVVCDVAPPATPNK